MARRRHRALKLLLTLAAVCALVPLGVTASLDGWGTRGNERTRPLPGDARTVRPQLDLTQAIAIRAAPEDVWPWLVQLGQNRGGFYSYAWLENLAGSGIENADRIVPEWQDLQVGDPVPLHPRMPKSYKVAQLDPPTDLLLAVGHPPGPISTWLFHLERQPDGSTRLIARLRVQHLETLDQRLVWEVFTAPASLVMQRAMLLGIRERVERASPLPPAKYVPGVKPPASNPLTTREALCPRRGT